MAAQNNVKAIILNWCYDTQLNDIQNNDTQHNDIQQNSK